MLGSIKASIGCFFPLIIVFAMPAVAHAEICHVFGVHDGDTITVRCGDKAQQRVRLAEIDAPELKQAYGHKSKQMLAEIVFDKDIEIQPLTQDRYGRIVARLYIDRREVQWDLVSAGLAWCYEKYLKQPECRIYEGKARRAHLGLWVDSDPVAPWLWRRNKK